MLIGGVDGVVGDVVVSVVVADCCVGAVGGCACRRCRQCAGISGALVLEFLFLLKRLLGYYGVCGKFDGVRLLVVFFLYKTNPNPRKNICCGKKWPKCHF